MVVPVLFTRMPNAEAVNPISFTANVSGSISAGASVTYTFILDEPIICPDMAVGCEVSLTFTNSNSAASTTNRNSIVWRWDEWRDTRRITLTVRNDITYENNSVVNLVAVASSNAEFYQGYRVTVTQNINLPESPEQTEVRLAAEAAAAARQRQNEIVNYRDILYKKLLNSEVPTLENYHNANFMQPNIRTLDLLTAELFKLAPTLRPVEKTINEIGDRLAINDDFFDPNFRPTVSIYLKNGISQISERILTKANAAILLIPHDNRSTIEPIVIVVRELHLVDLIANPSSRINLSPSTYVSCDLISAVQAFKYTIIRGLNSLPESDLDTLEKIKKQIAIQVAKVDVRKNRTLAITSKVISRR